MANLCMTDCPIMEKRPCPILNHAYSLGLQGMAECEIYETVKEIIKEIRDDKRK